MVWVNLLPWRQAALRQRKRLWGLLALGAMLMLVGLLLGGVAQRRLNQQQMEGLAIWRTGLNLATQLKARSVAAQQQLALLQSRQAERQQRLARWQQFANALGAAFPADLWLQQMVKGEHSLEINGFGRRIESLHQLRQQLENMPIFRQVTLGQIKRSRDRALEFTLQAQLPGAKERADD
ncbi:hypothetical protein SRABI13_03628 [Erwinia aphidicola]|uniref:PilN domain-containing protein n=1 Tax=Erwinia aphidicola TaxID=68334 RepID=A0ABU8DEP2_ERWAP|nr:PilN domain-containing protein [Erwinia aphidicola]CAH0275831.1 hypothetical protein SRABI13_03628 [Erwinia aphidicola]